MTNTTEHTYRFLYWNLKQFTLSLFLRLRVLFEWFDELFCYKKQITTFNICFYFLIARIIFGDFKLCSKKDLSHEWLWATKWKRIDVDKITKSWLANGTWFFCPTNYLLLPLESAIWLTIAKKNPIIFVNNNKEKKTRTRTIAFKIISHVKFSEEKSFSLSLFFSSLSLCAYFCVHFLCAI